jgi:hypothetical protein
MLLRKDKKDKRKYGNERKQSEETPEVSPMDSGIGEVSRGSEVMVDRPASSF